MLIMSNLFVLAASIAAVAGHAATVASLSSTQSPISKTTGQTLALTSDSQMPYMFSDTVMDRRDTGSLHPDLWKTPDGEFGCSSNAGCKSLDKNAVCSGSVKRCRCAPGFSYDVQKGQCLKPTKASCEAGCKAVFGKGARCKELPDTCNCRYDGPGNYYVWNDLVGIGGPDRCVALTQKMCNKLCAADYGKNAKCLKSDFDICIF